MIFDNFFSYNFTKKETEHLLAFFRSEEKNIPRELHHFYTMIEKKLYESLTISEIQNLLKNTNLNVKEN